MLLVCRLRGMTRTAFIGGVQEHHLVLGPVDDNGEVDRQHG